MHPTRAAGFEGDEYNMEHLAAHGIAPWEAEEVCFNRPVWLPDEGYRPDRWKAIGRTDSGRYLTVVVQVKDNGDTLRPFTGWPWDDEERAQYRKQRGEMR